MLHPTRLAAGERSYRVVLVGSSKETRAAALDLLARGFGHRRDLRHDGLTSRNGVGIAVELQRVADIEVPFERTGQQQVVRVVFLDDQIDEAVDVDPIVEGPGEFAVDKVRSPPLVHGKHTPHNKAAQIVRLRIRIVFSFSNGFSTKKAIQGDHLKT
jgi:hypothetical protein